MKMKPNIGIINALIRITIGFTILTWITAKLVKKPWRDSYLIMAMLGGMKIAEGIVRFCPITALFERGSDMVPDQMGFMGKQDHNHDEPKGSNGQKSNTPNLKAFMEQQGINSDSKGFSNPKNGKIDPLDNNINQAHKNKPNDKQQTAPGSSKGTSLNEEKMIEKIEDTIEKNGGNVKLDDIMPFNPL